MDTLWRAFTCPFCSAGIKWSYGDEGPVECDCAGGVIYIRPGGHTFAWPGGPASGMWSKERYDKATPVMPFEWHDWAETNEQIEQFPLDRFGGIDKSTPIHCKCGWEGTIEQHDVHVDLMKEQFVRLNSTPEPQWTRTGVLTR